MSLSLAIHPLSDDLCMYGDLDPSSAYSLSGHISLAVTSAYSIFDARRAAKFLLQSLSLTFEGQSEVFTPTTGYSSVRLCSVTRQLAPSVPIELSNEGHEDSGEPCIWNVIFNLPIPGWLPATTILGAEQIGTRYTLYASAKFTSIDEDTNQSTWSFASLCAPFRSRVRSTEASRSITVSRFISAPKSDTTGPATLNYLVNSTAASAPEEQLYKERIPIDILSKIQVLASVPEWLDVKGSQLPLTLRLRTKGLSEEECGKLQVTEVAVDIVQQEKCRHRPTSSYLSHFPLPPKAMQPPNLPLRDPHPLSAIYDVGLYVSHEYGQTVYRTFSLLPEDESGKYSLGANNYAFADDATVPENGNQTWYTMDTTIPFVHHRRSNVCHRYDTEEIQREGLVWAGPMELKPHVNGPLYSALHEVAISLTCTYDLQGKGGPVARERLTFKIPLNFTNVAPRLSQPVSPRMSGGTHPEPSVASLPVYSSLYDSNGDRRIDYSTPLPLYTPRNVEEQATPADSIPLIDLSSEPMQRSISTTSTIVSDASISDASIVASGSGLSTGAPSQIGSNSTVSPYWKDTCVDGDVEKRRAAVFVRQPDNVDILQGDGQTTNDCL